MNHEIQNQTDLYPLDHTVERNWLVYGVGKPSIRLLKEGEPATERQSLQGLETLTPNELSAWDGLDGRWVIEVQATEQDVDDVVAADDSAVAYVDIADVVNISEIAAAE